MGLNTSRFAFAFLVAAATMFAVASGLMIERTISHWSDRIGETTGEIAYLGSRDCRDSVRSARPMTRENKCHDYTVTYMAEGQRYVLNEVKEACGECDSGVPVGPIAVFFEIGNPATAWIDSPPSTNATSILAMVFGICAAIFGHLARRRRKVPGSLSGGAASK